MFWKCRDKCTDCAGDAIVPIVIGVMAFPVGATVHCTFSPVRYFANEMNLPYLPTLIAFVAYAALLMFCFCTATGNDFWETVYGLFGVGAGYVLGAISGDAIVNQLGASMAMCLGILMIIAAACCHRGQRKGGGYSLLPLN